MSGSSDLVSSVKRIECWMARNHPDRLPIYRPGADLNTLERVEKKLGSQLPPDIRILYATHDGQPEGAPNIYLNQRWYPLDLLGVAWEDLCFRFADHDVSTCTDGEIAASSIRTKTWSQAWLPLFGSSRGDHYCVDLRRDHPARFGQVIWFLYDRPERTVIAPSLNQLLSRVANGLESGEWQLDASYDGLSD